jgi:hypothetical protein
VCWSELDVHGDVYIYLWLIDFFLKYRDLFRKIGKGKFLDCYIVSHKMTHDKDRRLNN